MIFPIGDDQVQGGSFPIFSYAFIALNVLAFFGQIYFDPTYLMTCQYGSIPNEIIRGQDLFTILTSMFMHGGWMHLIGNMLFLWVFADNIEAVVGNFAFVIFYLLGGLAATGIHIAMEQLFMDPTLFANCCETCTGNVYTKCVEGVTYCPGSTPSVGASGAISAVMGAYLVMFPSSRIKMLVVYFFKSFHIPALLFLGFWIAQQIFSGFMGLGGTGGGVAWWAHIGGFVFGAIAGYFGRASVKAHNEGLKTKDFL